MCGRLGNVSPNPSKNLLPWRGSPFLALPFFLASVPDFIPFSDVTFVLLAFYIRWAFNVLQAGAKIPKNANLPDPNNPSPGKGGSGKSDGILYLGNYDDPGETTYQNELWLTNNDARTHILYLGTTGSGKTEGLKGLVTNALAWGSGFVYVDGKADTDLWVRFIRSCGALAVMTICLF